jgi:hypothetical protein
METSERSVYLVESEADSASWVSKGLVWMVALTAGLIVDIGLVAGAVYLAKRLWA